MRLKNRIKYRLAIARIYLVPTILLIAALSFVIFYIPYLEKNGLPLSLPSTEAASTATKTPFIVETPTHKPTTSRTPLPEEISDIDPVGNEIPMRLVPAGEFIMGSEAGDADEKPIHDVYLDTYYIDKYEVTNTLYQACVETGTCQEPTDTTYYRRDSGAQKPVVYVTWEMAETYCEWRGSRLPTEAEWEKAARGTDGRVYPWGSEDSCKHANYASCRGDIVEVGYLQYSPSPYGIYDMTGNAWEWVSDWYLENYYHKTPSDNPLGPSKGVFHVVRGGSWESSGDNVRTAERGGAENANYKIGFRCAKDAP